jgi:hypothetical protein
VLSGEATNINFLVFGLTITETAKVQTINVVTNSDQTYGNLATHHGGTVDFGHQ